MQSFKLIIQWPIVPETPPNGLSNNCHILCGGWRVTGSSPVGWLYEVPHTVVVFLEPAGPLVWTGSATIKSAGISAKPTLHTLYTLFNLYCLGLGSVPPPLASSSSFVAFSRWESAAQLRPLRSARRGPQVILQWWVRCSCRCDLKPVALYSEVE